MLGDVPILGTLFRSNEFRNDQTELVILVTPYMVRPVNDKSEVATPLDGYVPPSDFERIFLGKLHGGHPDHVDYNYPRQSPRLNGHPGFILK
jgi:pilus assembly protein CpaC